MAVSRDIAGRIKDLLKDYPEGVSITDIVKVIPINRNTASRYLDTLLVSGQVEMRHFGMAKLYSLAHRLPVSSVLSISSEYVMQLDRSLRIIYLNAPFLDLLEVAERDIVGKKIDYSRIPPLFEDEYSLLLRWISEGLSGVKRREELALVAKGRFFSCRVTPAVLADGQKGVSVLLEDITARKQKEEQLKDSEGKFRSIVEASTDGILVCDEEGRMIEWNNTLSQITGIPREEAIGVSLPDIMSRTLVPEDRNRSRIDTAAHELKNAIRTRKSRHFYVPFDVEIIRPDGERRVIQQTLFPIETKKGIRIGSVIHDITERNLMLKSLRENEEKFRTLFNNAADMITVHAIQPDGFPGTFIEVNDIACRWLGHTREELLRMSPADIINPALLESMRDKAATLRDEGHAVFEMIHVLKDGRRIPVEVRSHLIQYRGKTLMLVQVRDISRMKEAEAAIRESEARLQSIFRAAPVGIGLVTDRVIREVNNRLCEMVGYPAPELIGKSARILYTSQDEFNRVGIEKYNQIAREGAGSIETRWKRKDGIAVDILLSSTPLDPCDLSKGVTFTALDITERKNAEETLRTTGERYRALAESAADMIYITDCNGDLIYANTLCARMYGCTPAELIGRKQTDLFPPDIAREHLACIRQVMTTGEPVGHEESVPTPAGTLRIDIRLSPIRSPDGAVVSVVGIARDVTARTPGDPARRNIQEPPGE